MTLNRRTLLVGSSAAFVTGCAQRGTLSAFEGVGGIRQQPIIAATNRASLQSTRRTDVLSFTRIDVAVPIEREAGTVPVSGPNAFATITQSPIPTTGQLAGVLRNTDQGGPLVLWVHGYNNTAEEAIYRQAQLAVDAQLTGPQVSFVWPSAATPGGYIHDRDSVLHARQPLSDLIDTLTSVWQGDIILVAHSLGAFLAMETLARRARDGRAPRTDLTGLMLLQPDIAPEVFQTQARDAAPLPTATAVIAAETDPALRVSARVSQSERRVGATTDPAFYDALGIRLINVSSISDASQPHLVAFSSPTFLNLISRLQNQPIGLGI